MSEFARYLLLREDVDVVAAFVERERDRSCFRINTGSPCSRRRSMTRSSRPIGFSGSRTTLRATTGSCSRCTRRARASRGSRRGAVAINARLAQGDWTHRDIRDLVAREMGFEPVGFLNGGQLLDSRDDLEMRFPGTLSFLLRAQRRTGHARAHESRATSHKVDDRARRRLRGRASSPLGTTRSRGDLPKLRVRLRERRFRHRRAETAHRTLSHRRRLRVRRRSQGVRRLRLLFG